MLLSVQVELHKGWRGAVQLIAEVCLTAVAALLVMHQLRLMLQAQRHEGSPLAFHAGGLDTLALLSTALLCTTLAIWWTFVRRASRFTMPLRHPVYADMTADVFPMELADGGAGMVAAARAFEHVDETVMLLSWYYALNGVHVLVLVVRLLHLMHFHPRLGVITRSLVIAMPDLFNFLLVGGAASSTRSQLHTPGCWSRSEHSRCDCLACALRRCVASLASVAAPSRIRQMLLPST